MGRDRIMATRKRCVPIAYICSACKMPIYTALEVEVHAEKVYTIFSQSKAEKRLEEIAEIAIEREIRRVENCYVKQTTLVRERDWKEWSGDEGYISSLNGIDYFCPSCKNVELWQMPSKMMENNSKKISELQKVNFPTVFKDVEAGVKWVYDVACKLMEEIEEKRKDSLEIKQATFKATESVKKIQQLQYEITEMPEVKIKEKIEGELHKYKEQKKKIGILDFKRKKEVDLNIRMLEMKLNDIDEVVSEKIRPINDKIKSEKCELIYNQAVAFGTTGKVVVKKLGSTLGVGYKPNSFPNDLIIGLDEEVQKNDENSGLINEMETISETIKNEMLFCRKCGFKLIPNSKFCTRCGTMIDL